jgi:hypothetical protein
MTVMYKLQISNYPRYKGKARKDTTLHPNPSSGPCDCICSRQMHKGNFNTVFIECKKGINDRECLVIYLLSVCTFLYKPYNDQTSPSIQCLRKAPIQFSTHVPSFVWQLFNLSFPS